MQLPEGWHKGSSQGLYLEAVLSDRDAKALSDYIAKIASPTPPAQEDKPIAWFDENDLKKIVSSGFAANVLASSSKGGCCNIPLYTRPKS